MSTIAIFLLAACCANISTVVCNHIICLFLCSFGPLGIVKHLHKSTMKDALFPQPPCKWQMTWPE